jgi:hypothetical protein
VESAPRWRAVEVGGGPAEVVTAVVVSDVMHGSEIVLRRHLDEAVKRANETFQAEEAEHQKAEAQAQTMTEEFRALAD